METSWHSYPQVYALGHRYLNDLLYDPVLVEEKVDGSQFSFGVFDIEGYGRVLKCRSKGAEINVVAPDGMFKKGVEYVQSIQHNLIVGWTYRCEYLVKPKHNALAYDRVPLNNLILFDVNTGYETYLPHHGKRSEAERLNIDVVPLLHEGRIEDINHFRTMLDTPSVLGGQKVEGVVIKNYNRYGLDKHILIGKFVSEAFKEVHKREWKAENPSKQDVVMMLGSELKTPARWNKAIQHLTEAGKLEGSPRDIGLLMKEVPLDIQKEEEDYIKDKLFQWAWPHIRRQVTAGLPIWYKEYLLGKQFNNAVEGQEGQSSIHEVVSGDARTTVVREEEKLLEEATIKST